MFSLISLALWRKAVASCWTYTTILDNVYSHVKPIYGKKSRKYPFSTENVSTTPYDLNKYLLSCKMPKPQVCWHTFVDGFGKALVYSGEECDSKKNMKRLVYKKLYGMLEDPKTQVIAFPVVKKIRQNKDKIYANRSFQKLVFSQMSVVNRKEINSIPNEAFVDFGEDPKGRSIIKAKSVFKKHPNREKESKPVDEDHPNVLTIFIDTVSRERIWRKYPRLTQFLANAKNDPNFPAKVYEYKNLFSIGGWTSANTVASIYGMNRYGNLKEGTMSLNSKSIYSIARENGYITGFTTDLCSNSPWNQLDPHSKSESYEDSQFQDHFFGEWACDENLFPTENPFNLYYGPYGMEHRCFYKRDITEIQTDYVKQFWSLYSEKRKFMYMRLVSGHNAVAESHRYIDKEIEALLYEASKGTKMGDFFENTIINIYSDHGDHIGYPMVLSYSGIIERHKPFFFQIIPKKYAQKNNRHNNITKNENRPMSHYDLFKMYVGIFTNNDKEYKFNHAVRKKSVDFLNNELRADRRMKDIGILKSC